jgi:putative pyruvate formate lyase activating enzyme
MHFFIRPDASQAFEDKGVKKALGEYIKISTDKRLARFWATKAIEVEFSEEAPEEDLWEEHTRAVDEYREREADLRGRGISELKPPKKSLLDLKRALARRILESCHFCERSCGKDRAHGEKGFCQLDAQSRLSSEFIHMGEEACLVPSHTIFFIGCSLYCVFCQNWSISRQFEKGIPVTGEDLATMVKRRRLMDKSRNVNLVGGEPTPNTHTILDMLAALDVSIPVVWNSNMYMHRDTMKLLDGCVDVYLTDLKYGNNDCAKRLSKVERYWEVATRNHLLAFRQAEVLIRHLVLPNHVECCTRPILEWIAENLGNDVRINIMAQYRPEFEAGKHPDITRGVTRDEMERAFEIAKELGLWNLD